VRLALGFYGTLWLVAWVWRVPIQDGSLWLAHPGARVAWLAHTAAGLAAAGGVIALSHALTRGTRAGEILARRLAELVGPLDPGRAWLLALASGIGEEAFFRGALQPVVGLVPASLLFAAAHFVPRRDLLIWSVFSLAAGLLFGALYEATGTLIAPVVAHVVVNGVNLVRLVREYRPA
jgi:membrane protease YdiL (CAAX protease family)